MKDEEMYNQMPLEIRSKVVLGEQAHLFGGMACLIPQAVRVDAVKLRLKIFREIGKHHLAPGFSVRPICGNSLCVRISHMEVYQAEQIEKAASKKPVDDRQGSLFGGGDARSQR